MPGGDCVSIGRLGGAQPWVSLEAGPFLGLGGETALNESAQVSDDLREGLVTKCNPMGVIAVTFITIIRAEVRAGGLQWRPG